jgi:hypothetical protein
MNFLKTFGVAMVLCLSLLLSGVACALMAVSMGQQPRAGEADVVVSGIGNSGNTFGTGPSARRLARRVVERDAADPIDDFTLRAAARALIDRAKEGDPEAAAFVFELAAAQREKAKGSAPAPVAPQ